MEDLRKDYNVQKRKRSIDLFNWWRSNQYILKFALIIGLVSFILLKPDLIGHYTGKWFNELYVSFMNNMTITSDNWYLILISISTFFIIYKLSTIDFNSRGKR